LQSIVRRSELLTLLLVCPAVQLLLSNYFPLGLYLDLPLAFTLYVGWYSSPSRGAWSGTAFGLIQDAISGTYLGLNGLSKTLIGFCAPYLNKALRLEGAASRGALIAVLAAADGLLVSGLLLVIGQPLKGRIWVDMLIKAVATGAAAGLGSRVYEHFKFPRKDLRRTGET
jgi:rod shape-determining protein MreD